MHEKLVFRGEIKLDCAFVVLIRQKKVSLRHTAGKYFFLVVFFCCSSPESTFTIFTRTRSRTISFPTELLQRVSQTVAKYFHDIAFICPSENCMCEAWTRERDGKCCFVRCYPKISCWEERSFVFCVITSRRTFLLHAISFRFFASPFAECSENKCEAFGEARGESRVV